MKKIFLSLAVCALTACALAGAELKIAVIDMQKVFAGYDRTKTVEMKLNQQVEIYKEYAAKMMREYQTMRKEFELARDESQNVSLSEAERENRRLNAADKLEKLKRKETELKEYNQSRQKQLKETFEKQRGEILAEIRAVVTNHCALTGISLVVDKSAAGMSDLPLVIYSAPDLEITRPVLDELNRGYRAGQKTTDKK